MLIFLEVSPAFSFLGDEMLEFNKWFFVQLINFLVLIILLNRILFKPLLNLFKERGDRIKNALDSARAMEKEKEEMLRMMNTRFLEAKNQAKTVFENLKREGMTLQKELIEEAQKSAAEMSSKAREDLNAEVKKAKGALRREVEAFSKKIVEKLIGV